MATRTSSQSGNFNSTSTWGGSAVPVDGDSFIVSQGHVVTVNDDRRTTNGYADSYVYGNLKMQNNGKIRMNGVLFVQHGSTTPTQHFVEGTAASGAYFKMEAGSTLEIKGDDAANHHLRQHTHKYTWIECEGTDPRPKTTLSSDHALGSTSLSVASGTNIKAGDWINAYVELENRARWLQDGSTRDESWIVHDVSGNTVYFRQFVSPSSEITKASGSNIFVEDASVFRKGHKIIFGTGSNRNVKTINSINKNTNKIGLNSSVSGSVVGETVYQTGTEKWHKSGDTLKVNATPTTANSNSGTNTITVANTAAFSAGDRIWIEANNPADTNWDYEMRYEISSISGNTLTLTTNLANTRPEGAWVVPFDRDCRIQAATIEADASASTSEDRPFVWIQHWTSGDAYHRRTRFRNVLFEGIGANDNSTWYRGISMNRCGYETNSHSGYASGYDDNVWIPNNRGNNATVFWREAHYQQVRRSLFYNSTYGFWRWSSGNDFCFTGNISSRGNYCTAYFDGMYEPRFTCSYNHFNRSDDYGVFFYHMREGSQEIRHNYMVRHENRALYTYYQTNNAVIERNYMDQYRYQAHIGRGGGNVLFLNSYFGNKWDVTGDATVINGLYISSDGGLRPDRQNGNMTRGTSIHHNFREDDVVEWSGYWWKKWDTDEGAWRFRRAAETSNYAGDPESILVPAGATVYVAAECKATKSDHNGSYPFLVASSLQGYENGKYYNGTATGVQPSENVADGYPMGHYEEAYFTSAFNTAYERKTITVSPTNYDYYLVCYVAHTSSNLAQGEEGWYQKPLEIYIDKPGGVREKRVLGGTQLKVGQGINANTKKKRFGGRLR